MCDEDTSLFHSSRTFMDSPDTSQALSVWFTSQNGQLWQCQMKTNSVWLLILRMTIFIILVVDDEPDDEQMKDRFHYT